MPDAVAPTTSRKRSRGWRWVARIAIGIVALFLLVLIVGEIIFVTAMPRDIVVRAFEKQMGLKMSANSLSTGWLGHTTLHDVTLTLPLAEHGFVTVPTLEIDHTSLPWLAITGSLVIKDITIDHPTVYVTQDSAGRWNLQDVAQLIARAAGSKTASNPAQKTSDDIPQLPGVDVISATVLISDNKNRATTIEDLSLTGKPDGSLVWRYDAQVPDRIKVTGRVAPGGAWAHQVDFSVSDISAWASPWIKSWPHDAGLSGSWSGQLVSGGISGRLNIDDAHFAQIHARGPIDIGNAEGAIAIRPRGLVINDGIAAVPQISAIGGQFVVDSTSAQMQNVYLTAAGGDVTLDGRYTFTDGSANLRSVWQNITLVSGLNQSGSFSADYTIPFPGQTKIKAELTSHGTLSAGTWDALVDVNAQGSWSKPIDWTINAPKLRWDGSNHLSADLSGFIATFTTSSQGALLHDVHLGNGNPVAGSGGYDMAQKLWWFSLDGRGWPVPRVEHGLLDVDVDAWGNPFRIHLGQLYLKCTGLSFFSEGEYVFDLPRPVAADVYISEAQHLTAEEMAAALVRGSLQSQYHVSGTLNPIDLTFDGNATGSNLFLKDRSVGDIDLVVAGTIQDDAKLGPRVSLHSDHIKLFDGDWHIAGRWPVEKSLLRVDAGVSNLSIAQALGNSNIDGSLSADWGINVDDLSIDGLAIDGKAAISSLKVLNPANPAAPPLLAADQINVQHFRVKEGNVTLAPITVAQASHDIHGSAELSVSTSLHDLNHINLKINAAGWPYPLGNTDALAVAWVVGKLDVDTAHQSAIGHLDLRSDLSWKQERVAHVEVTTDINNRIVQVSSVKFTGLDGTGSGDAFVDFDQPAQSHATFNFERVNAARLQLYLPQAADLTGILSGSFDLGPATYQRPLEPSQFSIKVHPTNSQYQGLTYGDLQIYGYVGRKRIVLDDALVRPSFLQVAGGDIGLWGRITKYDSSIYQSLIEFDFHHIQLNDLIHAGSPYAKPTPGQIDGQFTIVGPLGQPALSFGGGIITISHSDLAGSGPIAGLYSLMNIGHDANKPVGTGTFDLSLAGGDLTLNAMRYFDRGTEVRASGTIGRIYDAPDSPINIVAVGSARPLAALKILPGFTDIDGALTALQQSSFAIQIYGPLNARPIQFKPIAFAGIGNSMKEFLLGDAGAATQ